MTQSKSKEAYKAAFTFYKEELDLNPKEIIIDPDASLTEGALEAFGDQTQYKTCSYFFHKHINEKARRSGILDDKGDQNIRKMLWCLKGLAFKKTEEVPNYFKKIQSFYRRF